MSTSKRVAKKSEKKTARKSTSPARKSLSKKVKEARKKPGGSNAGKYPKVTKFAGPAGGAPAGTFPLQSDGGKKDIKRGRAALALAHNAPRPLGIKIAVYAAYPSLKPTTKKKK